MQWLVTGNLAILIPGSRWGYRLLQSVYSELVMDSYQMKRRISWLTNHILMFKPIIISKKICEIYNTIVCISYSLYPFDWFNVMKIFLLFLLFIKMGIVFVNKQHVENQKNEQFKIVRTILVVRERFLNIARLKTIIFFIKWTFLNDLF